LSKTFYTAIFDHVYELKSIEIAEAAKLTENVFRAVNIALVNELKVIFRALNIDVWDVIEAATSKPFGYMPFYPGPGAGGDCVPMAPVYLAWRSREAMVPARIIELAHDVNSKMPLFVIDVLAEALQRRAKLPLSKAFVMILGIAYKRNVSDIKESPGVEILSHLKELGTHICFHDPHCETIPVTYEGVGGLSSSELSPHLLASVDAVVIVTDHDSVDYEIVSKSARLVIDSRNIMMRKGMDTRNVVKA
jgi:UDP-N-acetyl-D-glucosamine dehydrogenase